MGILIACGPTKLTISRANLSPNGLAAAPRLLPEPMSKAQWENNVRPRLQTELQEEVYGFMPDTSSTRIIDRKIIAESAYDGKASIEEYTLTATAIFDGKASTTSPFTLVVVIPKNTPTPMPIIMMQSFCPNHSTVRHTGVSKPTGKGFSCDGTGIISKTMNYVLGRYIATPPMDMILDHGYGFAAMQPSVFVPDRRERSLIALKKLSHGHKDDQTRWGAIAAWGWSFSRAVDILEQDERFAKDGFVAYGHSRYGKSALVAAAFDERIGAVMSHQSGTGGASLNKFKKGESVGEITKVFPHWFSKTYAGFAGHEQDMRTDQHALLALIAPRPIFLGNARRDVWSDPNGAFRAAKAANPTYKIYNKQGLTQETLSDFTPGADIAFWIRPGTHGVVKEDWPAFLEFMDAHYK